MLALITAYLYLILFALFAMMAWQYFRGTHDLLSFRNFAILGFCIFQLHSTAAALNFGPRPEMTLQNPVETATIYAIMATAFLAIALWTYNRGFLVTRLALKIPTARSVPSESALWALAIILIIGAFLLRQGIPVYPIYHLSRIFSVGMAVAACGILGWIWGPRLYNPVVIAVVAVLGLVAIVTIMTGIFGRRPLVAAGAALLWGVYFSNLRYQRPTFASVRLAAIAAVPIILVALYSTVRDQQHAERTGMEQLRMSIERGELRRGIELLSQGQDAGGNSLWLIETHPDQFPPRYFHTLVYTVVYPVPRELWPTKPEPLSDIMPHMARIQRVDRDALKIGPGIIGHIAAEGGWMALIVYGVVGGLFFRLLDEITWNNAHNPLVIIAIGSSFGHLIGMARGETSAFTALFILSVVMVYIMLLIIGKLLEAWYPAEAVLDDDGELLDEDAPLHESEGHWTDYGEPVAGYHPAKY